jgi:TRAP-type C4-dicarboxylate transport system permease small subunit
VTRFRCSLLPTRMAYAVAGAFRCISTVKVSAMGSIEKCVEWLVRILRIIGGFCLVSMMMVTCVDVVLRAFGHPIFGSVDIVGFLAVMVLAAAMPYTHAQSGHVGVALLVQRLSPRAQATIDFITSFVSLVLFGIVSWQMWLYAMELSTKGEVSMTIEIPVYPFICAVSVCFGILCLAIAFDVVRLGRKVVHG